MAYAIRPDLFRPENRHLGRPVRGIVVGGLIVVTLILFAVQPMDFGSLSGPGY